LKSILFLAYLSLASAGIPLFAGFLQWKRLHGNLKLIFFIPVASVLADIISLGMMNYRINTWPLINLFFLIQFSLLFQILDEPRKNTLLRILFFGCFSFGLLDFFFIQGPKTFNSYTSYVGGILMIISVLHFLYHLLTKMPVERVQTLPLFWIAFGVLIYYGGTLFLFLFNNYLLAHQLQYHQSIWILHNLLNITKNVFLFMALWMNYRKISQS
jgi:hypothetical protein